MPWARVRDRPGRHRHDLTQPRSDDLEDHDQQAGAQERDGAAAASLGDHPPPVALGKEVDLDLLLTALLALLVAPFFHTCLLMTRPMHVRYGPYRMSASIRRGRGKGSTGCPVRCSSRPVRSDGRSWSERTRMGESGPNPLAPDRRWKARTGFSPVESSNPTSPPDPTLKLWAARGMRSSIKIASHGSADMSSRMHELTGMARATQRDLRSTASGSRPACLAAVAMALTWARSQTVANTVRSSRPASTSMCRMAMRSEPRLS